MFIHITYYLNEVWLKQQRIKGIPERRAIIDHLKIPVFRVFLRIGTRNTGLDDIPFIDGMTFLVGDASELPDGLRVHLMTLQCP